MDPRYSHFRVRRTAVPRPHMLRPKTRAAQQGERSVRHKLTDPGVRLLWELRRQGLGPSKILRQLQAAGYVVTISTVNRILDGYSWNHLRPAWADEERKK